MALDYNPANFKNLDLRKYHIKDLNDVVRFSEFVIARMEEVRQVARTANNRINTLSSLNTDYQRMYQKKVAQYGNPVAEANVDEVKVETIVPAKNTSVEAEHNELLAELRAAGNTSEDRRVAELEVGDDIYRATAGKKRVMFYKNGRLTSDEKVPEETKEQLLSALGNTSSEEE